MGQLMIAWPVVTSPIQPRWPSAVRRRGPEVNSRMRENGTSDCNILALNGTVPRMLHFSGKVDLAIDIPETRTGLDSRMRGNNAWEDPRILFCRPREGGDPQHVLRIASL